MNKLPLASLAVVVFGLSCAALAPAWADEAVMPYTEDFAINPLAAATLLVSDSQAVSWSATGVREGKGALKLTNPDKTKNVTAIGPFIPFTGGKLTVSVEAKTDNVVFGPQAWQRAGFQIYYYDQDKKIIDYKWKGYNDIIPFSAGTADWDYYHKDCFIPATTNVAFIQIRYIMLMATGTTWIDKVSLTAQP